MTAATEKRIFSSAALRICAAEKAKTLPFQAAIPLRPALLPGALALGLVVAGSLVLVPLQILSMKTGDSVEFAGYRIAFEKVSAHQGPNYQEILGRFHLSRGGERVVKLSPSKRIYIAPQSTTSEAAIHASWAGDFYLVMGDAAVGGSSVAVRMYFNPLVRLIWIGALIMFIGGGVSLADRRLRIGVPARRFQPSAAAAAQMAGRAT